MLVGGPAQVVPNRILVRVSRASWSRPPPSGLKNSDSQCFRLGPGLGHSLEIPPCDQRGILLRNAVRNPNSDQFHPLLHSPSHPRPPPPLLPLWQIPAPSPSNSHTFSSSSKSFQIIHPIPILLSFPSPCSPTTTSAPFSQANLSYFNMSPSLFFVFAPTTDPADTCSSKQAIFLPHLTSCTSFLKSPTFIPPSSQSLH